MTSSVFECGNENCTYAIASDGLNGIQLKALRMWKKTCPKCGQMSHWQEKLPLLNTEILQTKINGGSKNAKPSKEARNENRRQKRAANGKAGYH